MGINTELEEPPVEDRTCNTCGKRQRLKATLLHWPYEKFDKAFVTMPDGKLLEPFSMWYYECAWCRAIRTKQKKRWGI